MPFNVGSVLEQKHQIRASDSYTDTLTMAQAEDRGAIVQTSESGTKIVAGKINPTTSVTAANVGKLVDIETGEGAEQGLYIIFAVVGSDYELRDDTNSLPTFTAEAVTFSIYDFPSIESDLNYTRTKLKEINGTSNWEDSQPTHADQDATGSDIDVDMDYLKDAHNKFQNRAIPITTGAQTLTTNDVGDLVTDTQPYTSATRNTGIPTSDGGGTPDATNYNLSFVSILDGVTEEPIHKADGTLIWGRLQDGTTAGQGLGGTGDGTDVAIVFYTGTNDGSATPYTALAGDSLPTTIKFIYHHVDVVSDVSRNNMLGLQNQGAFILAGGDANQADDIGDLQEYVGATDDQTTPTLDNATDFYVFSDTNVIGSFSEGDTDVQELLNRLNDFGGTFNFTDLANSIISDGDTSDLTTMLNSLAEAIANGGAEKLVFVNTGSVIVQGSSFSLPGLATYKPNADTLASGKAGKFMDVFIDGQLLAAHNTDDDIDYEETSGGVVATTAGTITLTKRNVRSGGVVTFIIRRTNAV